MLAVDFDAPKKSSKEFIANILGSFFIWLQFLVSIRLYFPKKV